MTDDSGPNFIWLVDAPEHNMRCIKDELKMTEIETWQFIKIRNNNIPIKVFQ